MISRPKGERSCGTLVCIGDWCLRFFSFRFRSRLHKSAVRPGLRSTRLSPTAAAFQKYVSSFLPPTSTIPEYTLVSDSVVYVVVGKSSNQLIPLAERIDFRIQRNELVVRVDDAKHESKFVIKEMIVRSEWDRMQRHFARDMKAAEDGEPER